MFFRTKKRIARQIAIVVENSIRPAFVFTEYLKEGKFNPPEGFWQDEYVVGFVHQLTALFLKCDFNSDAMSHEKKGEIVIRVFEQLCGDEWQKLLELVRQSFKAEDRSIEFDRGMNDAASLYFGSKGQLKPDDADPVVVKARSLADSMFEPMAGASDPASLGAAISVLTINQHVKDHYLEKAEGESHVTSR